ncbi:hypothetical protein ACFJIX_05315 [Roseateles sp. UC29_93]
MIQPVHGANPITGTSAGTSSGNERHPKKLATAIATHNAVAATGSTG